MKLYLLRHAETDWNLERRIQGHTDTPLNATGIVQAEQCRSYFQQIEIDAVYASTLDRTLYTALLATGRISCAMSQFSERHFGVWEGRLSAELHEDIQDYSEYFRDVARRAPGGESLEDVVHRVRPALSGILAETAPDADIVICSHGGTSKAIIGTLLDMPLPLIPTLATIGNGCVTLLVRHDEKWKMAETATPGIETFQRRSQIH